MIIERIKFKTRIGNTEGYFTRIGKGKYVRVLIPTAEFTEIKDEDIISRGEIDIDYSGKIKGGE